MIAQPSQRARDIHDELLARAQDSRVNDHRLAVLLAKMNADKLHQQFGHSKLTDYAVALLKMTPGRANGLRRIGDKLPELPVLNQAMASGELDWTKAREVAKKATPETEAAWVEFARTATHLELVAAIRQSVDGSPPCHVARDDDAPVRRVFWMSRREADIVADLIHTVRAACGEGTEPVEDGSLLAMVAQRVLADVDPEAAPSPERARFVVVNGTTDAGTDDLPGEACCDAEVVEMAGATRGHRSQTIPPATRRAVLYRDNRRCRVPGCSNRLWLDLHHVDHRRDGGTHEETNLLVICCVHHRLTHDGYLGIEAEVGGFAFVFPDGRRLRASVAEPKPAAGHGGG